MVEDTHTVLPIGINWGTLSKLSPHFYLLLYVLRLMKRNYPTEFKIEDMRVYVDQCKTKRQAFCKTESDVLAYKRLKCGGIEGNSLSLGMQTMKVMQHMTK